MLKLIVWQATVYFFFTEDENTEANLMFFWLRQTDDKLKTVAPAAGEHVKNLSEPVNFYFTQLPVSKAADA